MKIFNKTDDKAELLIYDLIGSTFWFDGVEASAVKAEIDELGEIEEFDVRINSEGGEVFTGMAIFNLLDQHPARKNIFVDGIAGSIASLFPFVANATVTMGANSWLMAHDAYAGLPPVFLSAAEIPKHIADVTLLGQRLEALTKDIANTYMRRVNVDLETVRRNMADEWWVNADEAIELGIADGKFESRMAAAVARDYLRAPAALHVRATDLPPVEAADLETVSNLEPAGTPNLDRVAMSRRVAAARSAE